MATFRNLAALFRYRGLIQTLVVRDLKARYRGSVLGFFWSFFNPLMLLLIYTFVFTKVLVGAHPEEMEPYALFMFCGILPWTWFASSMLESSNTLIAGGNLIKKVLFPAEVLPIVTVLANMVHFFLGLRDPGGVPDLLPAADRSVLQLLWFPVIVLVQLVLTIGLALFLSAMTVHFRDLKDLLEQPGPVLVFRDADHLSDARRFRRTCAWWLNLNPMTHLMISYQEVLFFPGPHGHWKWLMALAVGSIGVFLLGYFVFDRLRDSFAEEV